MKAAIALVLVGCAPQVDRKYVPEPPTPSVEANGLEFHYLEAGTGPLVLLLHGFPETAHTWDDVIPALADDGYHAVAPFMRGYAPTGIPDQDPDARTLGEDVLALIDALGESSAIVVGHDWGATAAYAAVALDPDKVDRMVTIAIPQPDTTRVTPQVLWGGRHFLYLSRPSAVHLMERDDFEHVEELYARWSPTWDPPDSEWEPVKNTFADEPSLDAALGYYRAASVAPPAFLQHDVAVPSMLVGGLDDGVLPNEAFTEDSKARFSGPYRVEMLPGGHFVHRESPEAFVEVLLDFLDGST